MDAVQAVIEIENSIGRWTHYLTSGQYDKIPNLFCRRKDTRYEQPDDGICCQGYEAVSEYFRKLCPNQHLIRMAQSPVIQIQPDGISAVATWMCTSFDIFNDVKEEMYTEQFAARIDARLFLEENTWRFVMLAYYNCLSLVPEKLTTVSLKGIFLENGRTWELPEKSGETTAEDFIEIQKILGRWCHNNRKDALKLFADRDDISMVLPPFVNETAYGRTGVRKALVYMEQLEANNSGRYLMIPMLFSPVIEVGTGRKNAKAVWLTLVLEAGAPPTGHEDDNSPVTIRMGVFTCSFVRENGQWRILSLMLTHGLTMPETELLWKDSQNCLIGRPEHWRDAPEETGVTDAAAVLELEQFINYWTAGLRYRSEAPFYFTKYALECPDMLSYELPRGKMVGLSAVTKEIFGMTDMFGQKQPKEPGIHVGSTPVVEIDPSGETATAVWMDFGWTLMGHAFFENPPFYAKPSIARYQHKFIKIQGKWKLYDFSWMPFYRICDWQFDPQSTKGWAGTTSTRRFPLPLEEYIYENDPEKRNYPIILQPPIMQDPILEDN